MFVRMPKPVRGMFLKYLNTDDRSDKDKTGLYFNVSTELTKSLAERDKEIKAFVS